MSFNALDTSQSTANLINCLKQNGIVAVGRYYAGDRALSKVLTAAEASALSAAGIKIWTVYQDSQNQVADFNQSKGSAAASAALSYAQTVIGQPKGSGIYFAVDFDASATDFSSAITPFFEAIKTVFSAAGSPYRIGVYGSGLVCQGLLNASLVQLTWLSQSKGFQQTAEFSASNRWNLTQQLSVSNFCNFDDDIDPDVINPAIADFGGFLLTAAAPQVAVSVPAAPEAALAT